MYGSHLGEAYVFLVYFPLANMLMTDADGHWILLFCFRFYHTARLNFLGHGGFIQMLINLLNTVTPASRDQEDKTK